jgi:hypothetical protein
VWSGWKDKEGAKERVDDGTTAISTRQEGRTLLILVDISIMPSVFIHGER